MMRLGNGLVILGWHNVCGTWAFPSPQGEGARGLATQLRYFEVAPGGWTTLERHEHVHAVMVIRGRGRCLVGDEAWDLEANDLVTVPPMTWHQFRAAADAPLGFLCLVASERDRPQLPPGEDVDDITRPLRSW